MPSINSPIYDRGHSGAEYRQAMGRYIRGFRIAGRMTQTEVANAVGVGKATISATELGRLALPPGRYLQFAEALGVDAVEFVKEALQNSNPWAFAVLFKDNPKAEFRKINNRINSRSAEA
jgi:transcriptional regulator with XRE-family HTH domain